MSAAVVMGAAETRPVRTAFATSREMDFFSEKELVAQAGHQRDEWPQLIVKELVDNALDACEEAGVAPRIRIVADESGISVMDNGPGIPEKTLEKVMDLRVRVSSREAYCSPTRGAQGNALKTLIGMPYVIAPAHGRLVVTTGGTTHSIACRLDGVSEKVRVEKSLLSAPSETVKMYESSVRIEWGPRRWPFSKSPASAWRDRIETLIRGYALVNPHLTIRLDWFGERLEYAATDAKWKKWQPSQPMSAHWYDLVRMERLVRAYINHERENGGSPRTVADFLNEFDGLQRSQKQTAVMEQAGLKRTHLSDLVAARGTLRSALIDKLLVAMKESTKPVNPARLGQVGKAHFEHRLREFGCKPESVVYKARKRLDHGIPSVVEAAFGCADSALAAQDTGERRRIYPGVNWSPGIKNPFRSFGATGEGLEGLLERKKIGAREPVVFALHLASPRVQYADRGKSSIVVDEPGGRMSSLAADLETMTTAVTKKWTKQRKAEERDSGARAAREYMYSDRVYFTEVASKVIPPAYAKVSGDGELPAFTRQLYYVVRPEFKRLTGRDIEYEYFSQNLLPKYLERRDTANWKVTSDPRGALVEPHTEMRVPIGTLEVDDYLAGSWGRNDGDDLRLSFDYPTRGPENRYQALLYIEKEGFNPLFRTVKLAERFDIAIMSCKGQSVIAARKVADELCNDQGIPLLVLHDLDKYGFSIFQSLTSVSDAAENAERVRYRFANDIHATDLGLRLEDVKEWGLEPERCKFTGGFDEGDKNITEAEKKFLRAGQRVELNAFTSPDFIAFVEKKLRAAGIREKLVPDDATLLDAWRRAHATVELNEMVEAAQQRAAGLKLPRTLRATLRKALKTNPEKSWDTALYEIVKRGDS